MNFIEIDYKERNVEWSMSDLQSHNYFELYFLLEGSRQFFLKDKIFHINAPTVCIIPPFCMHKTEGCKYKRININVSPSFLTENETAFLSELGKTVVFTFDLNKANLFLQLLEYASTYSIDPKNHQLTESFLHVLLHLLENCLSPLAISTPDNKKDNSIIMQIVGYIHNHFNEDFSIQDLCNKFFISKNALCVQFRKLMQCSIMQYRQFIRISKAKELLSYTKKDMEIIAEECGFSSANYFSLIFKKEVGLSPVAYRKAK